MVMKPANNSTDNTSHGGPLAARSDDSVQQEFVFIVRFQNQESIILKFFLTDYNLTRYAITKNNEINNANSGTNPPRLGGFPPHAP